MFCLCGNHLERRMTTQKSKRNINNWKCWTWLAFLHHRYCRGPAPTHWTNSTNPCHQCMTWICSRFLAGTFGSHIFSEHWISVTIPKKGCHFQRFSASFSLFWLGPPQLLERTEWYSILPDHAQFVFKLQKILWCFHHFFFSVFPIFPDWKRLAIHSRAVLPVILWLYSSSTKLWDSTSAVPSTKWEEISSTCTKYQSHSTQDN